MPTGKEPKGNDTRTLMSFIIMAVIFTSVINIFMAASTSRHSQEISYTQFLEMLEDKKVDTVERQVDRLIVTEKQEDSEQVGLYSKPNTYIVGMVDDPELTDRIIEAGANQYSNVENNSVIYEFMVSWVLPSILIYAVVTLLMRSFAKRMGGGGGPMSFGKNTAKIYAQKETGVTFADVAGQEEAKESLNEIVDFLHQPDKYNAIGAKLPKGALLVGPPGTGKTLLAKAVAGEANVPFYSLSGSDFVEMFVGVGASRVRDLFKQAVENAPCIVFIDEIDAIGKSRDNQIGGNDEREQTLNQLLAEMDGFDSSKGVVILGATNRPEVLDKALLRPGRFDRRVIVEKPDLKGRKSILEVHVKSVKLSDDVDLDAIALATSGCAGADLANIVNEAALRAVRLGRDKVNQGDFMEAIEVIIAGKEKKDRILTEKEKEIVSYHEVGHALAAALQKITMSVQKITIVPRTMGSLGYTMQMPEEEKYLMSKEEMLEQITTLLAGRSAEEVIFNICTTGASNDIERATAMARAMVAQYGMSDNFDMMGLESIQNRYLDGRNVRNCGEVTSAEVDSEVLKIITECHKKAVDILKNNEDALHRIAKFLIEKETTTGKEFMDILNEGKEEEVEPEVEA